MSIDALLIGSIAMISVIALKLCLYTVSKDYREWIQ